MPSPANRRTIFLLTAVTLVALTMSCGPKRPPPADLQPSIRATGAGRVITQLTRDPGSEVNPALSPDGKTLAYVKTSPGPQGVRAIICAIDPNQASGEVIYTGENYQSWYPFWMPDQSGLAMVNNSTGKWAVVRTLSNSPGAAIRVIVPGEVASDIDWCQIAPDGKRIYFDALMGNSRKLAYMSIDGIGLTVIGEGAQPALSHNGKLLAFVRNVNSYAQIFVADAEHGGNLTQLTRAEKASSTVPTWSADDRWLAFVSTQGNETLENAIKGHTQNVMVMAADGSKLTPVTTGSGNCDWPHWGSDGRIYFAYKEVVRATFDLWRVELDQATLGGK